MNRVHVYLYQISGNENIESLLYECQMQFKTIQIKAID